MATDTKVFGGRPHALTDAPFTYCPGCTHGISHRLIAEVLDELGVEGRAIAIAPVGCSVLAYEFFNCDGIQAAHGRAPAVACAVARTHPDAVVFTYQGDGDLASIGAAEMVHAATRGDNIVIIFINNAIYGMTGGQLAPTSLLGQVTQTSPYGREVARDGHPIRVVEMLSTLEGVALAQRVALDTPAHIREAKRAIKRAFENQIAGKGFSIVELLSTCPTNWGLSPADSFTWLQENLLPYYPLGVYKEIDK
ncbi:MAG: thiamine pyrophosphate-dependent enzyme [Coriobacteriia bacterium]|nr:thiamine pyrophosphate-dependent enzyme [Coriobacteriia bacterium]